MKEKLISFIKNNQLNFNTTGSGLNSACVIISGYSLSIENSDVTLIVDSILEVFPQFDKQDELEKVFNFAERNNYEKWWSYPEAKKMYQF